MATVGHLITGLAVGRAHDRGLWKMVALSFVAEWPDIDFIFFNHEDHAPYAHRGCTHSVFLSIVVGVVAAVVFRNERLRNGVAFGVASATHGLIDSFGALGTPVCVLWPFYGGRIETGHRFIPVMSFYFHPNRTLVIELLAFSPLLIYALWPRGKRSQS